MVVFSVSTSKTRGGGESEEDKIKMGWENVCLSVWLVHQVEIGESMAILVATREFGILDEECGNGLDQERIVT